MSVIGTPLVRRDARLKVTGAAPYVGDLVVPGVLHGVFVTSTIARGRIAAIDSTAALRIPGIVQVFTHENMPRFGKIKGVPGQAFLLMQANEIQYEGQYVAFVVAETLMGARDAARLVEISYVTEHPRVDFRRHLELEETVTDFAEPDTSVGDVRAGLAAADITISSTFRTADRHHVPMEPAGTLAEWRNGDLLLHDATQWGYGVRMVISSALGLPQERVRVTSTYVGGGFGSKGFAWPHQLIIAAAAMTLERSVRGILPRALTFTGHGYQPATEQEVTLGAHRDGTLLAIRHRSVNPTSIGDEYPEYAAMGTRSVYACPAIETATRVVRVNRNVPTPMRAPHEGPGMVALEIAMDELAVVAGVDPVELRLRNYAETDPTSGLPFSSKALRECYRIGAEKFGWAARTPAPRSMRDGSTLIGWGMATALMTTFRFGSAARVTIRRDGRVVIETGTQEIGTGVLTIMPQIAADALGVPVDQVDLIYGDTDLPEAGGTFGSATTLSVGSAVLDAATRLKARLIELGGEPELSPAEYTEVLKLRGLEQLTIDGGWSPQQGNEYSMQCFGAVFAEVRVDERIPIPRVSRCVGCYSVGRIINPRTARSQLTGGIIWGIGQALLEDSRVDPVTGRYLSKNLSGYLIPSHADVPAVEAYWAEEHDPHASALGARGVGEVGAVGVGPAIANAVFHATGVRVREVPIRVEMLL
ncbi:MAG: xanthine dehydrogenase family protein molybdopterin-binding subunit [Gemmatimonadota bacterium]